MILKKTLFFPNKILKIICYFFTHSSTFSINLSFYIRSLDSLYIINFLSIKIIISPNTNIYIDRNDDRCTNSYIWCYFTLY